MGRMAPRSLRETESPRLSGSAVRSQSMSTLPRKRKGEAPEPGDPTCVTWGSCTPASLRTIPVFQGSRPESTVACPGAVSVMAWSW